MDFVSVLGCCHSMGLLLRSLASRKNFQLVLFSHAHRAYSDKATMLCPHKRLWCLFLPRLLLTWLLQAPLVSSPGHLSVMTIGRGFPSRRLPKSFICSHQTPHSHRLALEILGGLTAHWALGLYSSTSCWCSPRLGQPLSTFLL